MPTVLETPPGPPEIRPGYSDGDGRGRPPWQLWVALLVCAAFAVYLTLLGVRAIRWQPFATTISVAWAIASLIITHRRFYLSDDRRSISFYAWAIVGGLVAESIQVVATGRPTIGILWILLGVIGIGGGFGVGAASITYAWYGFVYLARLLLKWRAA